MAFWRFAILLFVAMAVSASVSPLFDESGVVNIGLRGPLSQLFDHKDSNIELPFVLTEDGIDLEVTARVRGKSRRSLCNFPPIRLNFENAGNNSTVFSGQDKLKLVTHCRNGSAGEQNLLEEYAAYRIFSLLSDAAYRVRLLRIDYFDDEDGTVESARQNYGFVIETTTQLAERLGGEKLEIPGVVLSRLNKEQAALVYVFQYLIGSTDWSLVLAEGDTKCCHNGDLIEAHGEIYLIPYDFDLSGLVNAPYAKPHPSLRLPSVRTRLYRGYCTESAALRSAIQKVNSREQEVYQVVNDLPGFDEKQRKRALKYLSAYYKKSGDEEKLLRSFEKKCLE